MSKAPEAAHFGIEQPIYVLRHWLRRHGIDPKKVGLTIRANDDETLAKIERAIQMDTRATGMVQGPVRRTHEIAGIRVAFSGLDTR